MPSSQPEAKACVQPLNEYGDVLVRTTGLHGSDISSQRIDDLDRAALRFVLERDAPRAPAVAVDIGAGLGAQTARFAALGLQVTMIDLVERADFVRKVNSLYGEGRVTSIVGDVRRLSNDCLPLEIDLLYSQRTIHYMRFAEAVGVLRAFAERMTTHARLFLSCACSASELAEGYPAIDVRIEDRLAPLAPFMAKKHNVLEPLCLYSREEFGDLAERAGFYPLEITQSQFGTLKGIFGVARGAAPR